LKLSGSPPNCAIAYSGANARHVAIAVIAVQIVAAAAVERDDVAAHGRVVAAALLDLGRDGGRCVDGRLSRLAGRRGLDAGRDVLGRVEPVELEAGTRALVLGAGGGEAVRDKIVRGIGDLQHATDGTVMIGHHEAVRGDEGRRAAARDARRRLPNVVEKRGIGREAVGRANLR